MLFDEVEADPRYGVHPTADADQPGEREERDERRSAGDGA
jgi:hypothetical protein